MSKNLIQAKKLSKTICENLPKLSPRMFLLGCQSWFDYTHHDPEFIEGSEFVWIPPWNNGQLLKRHDRTMIRIPQWNDELPARIILGKAKSSGRVGRKKTQRKHDGG
jgi:hypothetical protein